MTLKNYSTKVTKTCIYRNYGYYVLVTEVDPLESGQVFVTFKAKIKEIFKIGKYNNS